MKKHKKPVFIDDKNLTEKITLNDYDPKKHKETLIVEDKFKDLADYYQKKSESVSFDGIGYYQKIQMKLLKTQFDVEISKLRKLSSEWKKKSDARSLVAEVKTNINLVRHRNVMDISGWTREMKERMQPGKSFMVNMELRNGMNTHFMVVLKEKYFDFEEGRYIIDDAYKYFDIASKNYFLDYHQDCCIPIKRRFNLKKIEAAVMDSGYFESETVIDPKTLKIFSESEIIQKIMKGAEMEKWINFVKWMLIIIVVECSIVLALMIKALWSG